MAQARTSYFIYGAMIFLAHEIKKKTNDFKKSPANNKKRLFYQIESRFKKEEEEKKAAKGQFKTIS